MTVPLTGASGLFTRIGHLGGQLNNLNTYRGTTTPPRFNTIFADYASTDQAIIDSLYSNMSSFQNGMSGMANFLAGLASDLLIQMVNEDTPQSAQSFSTALNALIVQMRAGSNTVDSNTIASSFAAGSANVGNSQIVVSNKTKLGYVNENTFAEKVVLTCIADAQSGGTVAGQEQYLALGQYAETDRLHWLWPIGSASAVSMTAVDAGASQVGGTQNALKNSNFETWTVANIPDGWTVDVGTVGTTIKQSTGVIYDGLSSLNLLGNGVELTSVYQTFGTDTTVKLTPLNQYAVNFWAKAGSAPAAGVLEVALTDGTGTIVNDNLGVPNSFTVNLVTLSTGAFAVQNGVFRTPAVLPATLRLRIRCSTALSNSKQIFIDRLSFAEMTSLYRQGPRVCVFSGNVNAIANDQYTITTTNDRAGQFQTLFDRFFDMRSLGLLLPSAGSGTIADSLIT